jgi:molybdopterin-guanine dinucleotide biosynthesis protein MobB
MGLRDDPPRDEVTIGVLLAGGEARRLGADKRGLRLGGATLLERNLTLLREIFSHVAISLRAGQDLGAGGTYDGAQVLTDSWTGSPLAAIVTALEHFKAPVFVLACDLALPERRAIEQVLEAFRGVDVALPMVDDKLEPLHAVYGPACLAPMRRLLERDRHRIIEAFPDVRVATVPFPSARPFFNINHPEDYEQALRREVERLVLGEATRLQHPAETEDSTPAAGPSHSQPALVAIVGKSDSGKTTLIESLLPELRRLGLRVGTIKHDVHGFEIDTPGKDSWRHARAGADASMIAGPDKLAYVRALSDELPLAEIARRYFSDLDLVVAEGYKRQAPHRIEVFRRDAGHADPLCGPGESLALVTDIALEHPHRFSLDDADGLAAFIGTRLQELRRY